MIQTDPATKNGSRELITFIVASQEFCVDIVGVREIRVWTPATPLAHAPAFMCGVINLPGAVVPIIDLAIRLGLPPTVPSNRHAILVIEAGAQVVGLLVAGVSEILTVSKDMVQPAPDVASSRVHAFVEGILAIDERLISLLSFPAILPEMRIAEAA